MIEQRDERLIIALESLEKSQMIQAEAINRLAAADETLISLIAKTLIEEDDEELPPPTYLSGKPR